MKGVGRRSRFCDAARIGMRQGRDRATSRHPKSFTYRTNGIDPDFLHPLKESEPHRLNEALPLTVTYAGNLGEGQGLHEILPELALRMGDDFRFRIIGDGGRRLALQAALEERRITNVELHAPVTRRKLVEIYEASDVLFLHLNDYRAFERVLPSKVFEYAATGKPIWAGAAGYAAEFIGREVTNSAVFRPCDVDHAVRVFKNLALRTSVRSTFVAKYDRAQISKALAKDLLSVLTETR